ncbi:hypothetical protein HII31_07057 [Pseudocercospora fuligena]|uniref:HNH domain-containing protein n=1 Tax=Pseudocercospora fuligena TaxID=685502 RepID=A0A8H6VLX9_9PEZI|nr:hypothetical protein HII31_07057 [Pseudocercospora fuligena]
MISSSEVDNFDIFKDCLSTTIVSRLAPESGKASKKVKGRKNEIKPVRAVAPEIENGDNDAAELAEFIEYLAEEIFLALPAELRTLSYAAVQEDSDLMDRYAVPLDTSLLESLAKPLPLTIADSLTSYGLIHDETDLEKFLEPALTAYVTTMIAAPPEHTPAVMASRPDGCEICEREHLPLTYHHLIPRAVHAKAVKRGWHKEWELQKVAWLCRACHSFVHKIASNQMLAKELYSVELLVEREDVQRWAMWVGRVRWKAR